MKPLPPLRVTVMPNRTANYRGYAIEGDMNGQGWSVEVHPRGPDFPFLSQSGFGSRILLGIQHSPRPLREWTLSWTANWTRNRISPQHSKKSWRPPGTLSRLHPAFAKSGPNVQTQLRLALARCIVALAANGITDPTELRRQAVERIVLGEEVASSGSSLVAQRNKLLGWASPPPPALESDLGNASFQPFTHRSRYNDRTPREHPV